MHAGPALAGAGPNARLGAGPLWAVLYDVIVLIQPCYDLFEKMAYIQGYHTVLKSKICPYFAVLRLRKH